MWRRHSCWPLAGLRPAVRAALGWGRGRDAGYPAPPAQTRAGAPNAHGSYLGYLAANRSFGHGCRTSTGGSLCTKSLQKTSPRPSALLAPPAYLAEPQTKHLTTEPLHSLLVVRYGVILEISANHRLEPLQVLLDRFVHPFSQFLPNILQLGRHAFADRLASYREIPFPAAPTDVCETQKIEGFRLSFPTLLPALGSITPELNQARLVRV